MVRTWAALAAAFLLWAAPVSAADTLAFGEMYIQSVLGIKFTPKLTSLTGKQVTVTGFMAPLLRVQADFFVLTRQPVSLCPFCNTDADWPTDILVIYLKNGEIFSQHSRPIDVTGRLEVGSKTDPDTGFVSLVRIVDAELKDH
jgi:hypothetical protein